MTKEVLDILERVGSRMGDISKPSTVKKKEEGGEHVTLMMLLEPGDGET